MNIITSFLKLNLPSESIAEIISADIKDILDSFYPEKENWAKNTIITEKIKKYIWVLIVEPEKERKNDRGPKI